VALDFTERLVAERALRLSEHSYRSLIEEAPYAICRCTPDGQLLQVNRAMVAMLGYEPSGEGELLMRDLDEVFVEGFPALRAALLAGAAVEGMAAAWRPREGALVQVLVSGRAFRDAGGAVSHLNVLAENVTEKKLLEEQLNQAQKMQAVGQLAGGVAHDFNNLLTVISGYLEMVLEDAGDPVLRGRLERIQQAADRAATLTRQLLAYSRRQVLQTRAFDLNEVLGNLMGMLSRVIKENVDLAFRPGPGLSWVRADPLQIEQVLINVIVNAQDAMPEGGQILLETRNLEEAGGVQIMVRDTGIGMDSEVKARVFEPFFTTKKVGEGTGLGLSMAYGIVAQSGGTIRLESAPGAGCTLWITLPGTAPVDTLVQVEPPGPAAPRGTETLLLAEDEVDLRELLASYLRHLGYQVLATGDGLEALTVAARHAGPIHLLVSDLIMPRCGGRDLATALRQTRPEVRVVFLSGYAGHGPGEPELAMPAGHFMAKPLAMETLARAVREVLDED